MKTRSLVYMAALVVVLSACTSAGSDSSGATSSMSLDTSAPLEPQAKEAILADNIQVLEEALAAGLDLSADLGGGYTPLHIAANAGMDDIVTLLLDEGAPVDAVGDDGVTPLMFAAAHGRASTVDLLVAAGASQTVTDELAGATALHYAAFSNNVETMEALIKAGSDIEQRNALGETTFLVAVHENNIEAVQFMIDAGADLTARRNDGGSATEIARAHIQPDILALLEAAGAA